MMELSRPAQPTFGENSVITCSEPNTSTVINSHDASNGTFTLHRVSITGTKRKITHTQQQSYI